MKPETLAACIDHTLLRPDATAADIRRLCAEARQYGFAAVCVNPTYVALAAEQLAGSHVKVCTVSGFPLGAHLIPVKAAESLRAIKHGAQEVDVVINIGALKDGDTDLVGRELKTVVDVCHRENVICKVIIETALLTDDEKRTACRLARDAGADFVKTSTGFASGGATAADVALMADAVKDAGMGVKASGGIRSLADALAMIGAGATRIGASAGVPIVDEARRVGAGS